MRKLIFLSIVSIVFGGIIYTGFRSSSIILFNWIEYIGLINLVENLRIFTLEYKDSLPLWFLYSLPDGLWMFSYSCIVLVIWKMEVTKHSLLCILSLLMFSIIFEILQYYQYVNGTFDIIDIIFFIFGGLLPLYINQKIKHETLY